MKVLQRFSYRDSPYARPTQKWICGRTSDGEECEIGPDLRGRCIVQAECSPRKEGARWHCTRTSKFGGPCSDGPLPNGSCCLPIKTQCSPIRSWRFRRTIVTRWAAAAVLGVVLVCLGYNGGKTFISPGGLSTTHLQLSDCGLCHTAFEGGPRAWIHTALSGQSRHDDSKACLACHNLGLMPLKQHGIEAQTSTSIEAHWPSENGPSYGITPVLRNIVWNFETRNNDSLTCATCHKEHQGIAFTNIENVACLECHGDKFTGFTMGHPGYETYPYKRRTRINFDHITHFGTHFEQPPDPLSSTPETLQILTDCTTCHQPDPEGISMVMAPFADACGQCHTGQIEGEGRATEKGIAILSLPDIDTWTLSERNVPIGYWPDQTEGELTIFMDILLSNNIQYQAIKPLLTDLDLTDLSDASADQIAGIETLVWAVKDLLFQTRLYGPKYLRSQLEYALGPLNTMDIALLTGYLSQDVINNAVESWLPHLENEISLWSAGEKEQLISGLPGTGPEALESNSKIAGNDPKINPSEDDILLEEEISLEDDEISLAEDDILLEEEISLEDDEISLAEDDILLEEEELAPKESGRENRESLGNQVPSSPAEWASAGGWYADNNTYSLRYRPVSHADKFLMHWLNISGQLALDADLFTALAKEGSPGNCSKCHSIDLINGNQKQINWMGASPETRDPALVRYPHLSHFGIVKDKSCTTCHRLAQSSSSDKPPITYDPSVFNSNFVSLDQTICSDCHSAESAVNGCTTCHNYHFVRPQTARTTTVRLHSPE